MLDHLPDKSLVIVGLGEALFDCFGERQVLGGAPLNFAVHARQLLGPNGDRAAVATRVGDDPLGRRCLDELRSRGIDVTTCQIDPELPTGTVEVTLDAADQPSYRIVEGVAWDRLQGTQELADLAARCDAICFGTLAQRDTASRQTIRAFLAAAPQALRLCDLNLRTPHYDAEVVEASLRAASAAKCNREELAVVGELLGRRFTPQELADAYELDWVAVTDAERGTALHVGDAVYASPATDPLLKLALPREPDADGVGAGDACGAALVVGMLRGLPPQEIVRLANAAGAFVASRHGATPTLPAALLERFAAC